MRHSASLCLFFLLAFGLLLQQSHPSVPTGDSSEFIVNAVTLGINHPAGYPLYALCGKAFSLLPLGAAAMRVNLFSVATASLAALLLFITSARLCCPPLALLISSVLPLGMITLSQATVAEVYSLNLFFFALIVSLATNTRTRGKWLSLLTFLFFLALGNHYLMLLSLPLLLLAYFWGGPVHSLRQFTQLSCFAMIGLSAYCYLPLRSSAKPPLNWGHPDSYVSLINHLSRKEYRTLEFSQSVPLSEKAQYLIHFAELVWQEFPPLYLLAGLAGLYYLIKQRRPCGYFLLLEFCLYSLGLIMLLHFPYRIQDIYRVTVYYLPAFYLWLLFSSYLMANITPKTFRCIPIIYLIMILFWYASLSTASRHNFLTYDYLCNLQHSAPPGSQIVTEGDNETFGLFYLRFVESKRTDLDIYNKFSPALRSAPGLQKNRLVAYANQKNAPPKSKIRGLLFLDQEAQGLSWRHFSERGFKRPYSQHENFERELVASHLIARGLNQAERKQQTRATQNYLQAADIGREFAWINNHSAVLLQSQGLFANAITCYNQAITADPSNLEAYYNLGILLRNMNNPNHISVLEKYLQLSQGLAAEVKYRQRIETLLDPKTRG